MKCKSLSLSIAVLLCLMAMPLLLSHTAFAGVGCGSNWMGDTSGDTDFWVSKNQGGSSTSSTASSTGQASSSKPALALGQAAKANKNATIESMNPDKPAPESPGSVIVWTAAASNPNNEKMLYRFLLTGPATGGLAKDETGWTEGNSWTWTTTDADAGDNLIEVQVTRAGSAGFEDRRTQSFFIGTEKTNAETAAVSPAVATTASSGVLPASDSTSDSSSTSPVGEGHPESKTGEPISDRPRVAPDERQIDTQITSGPNMQMPDTKPIPLNAPAASQGIVDATAAAAEKQSEVQAGEPEYMEVEGKWTIKLEDSGATLNPLTIIQTGGSVMGMGTLNEKSSKIQVSAKGSVSDNTMDLDVWTVISEFGNKVDERITLDLVKVDRTVSGSYEMYSGEDLIGQGNATATRFAS